MKRKIFGRVILAIALVFGMTVIGCDNDTDSSSPGPQWVPVTGAKAEPFTGVLSNDGVTITFAENPFYESGSTDASGGTVGYPLVFTRNGISSGGSLNGEWIANEPYLVVRLTISDNNWILAYLTYYAENFDDDLKGTLTVTGSTITFKATHSMYYGENEEINH